MTTSSCNVAEISRPTSAIAAASCAWRFVSWNNRPDSIQMDTWCAIPTRKFSSDSLNRPSSLSRQALITPIVSPRRIRGAAIRLSSFSSFSGVPGMVTLRGSSRVSLMISGLPLRKTLPVIPSPTLRVWDRNSLR